MTRLVDIKNIIEYIAKEIVLLCAAKGENVSPERAERTIKMLLVDPDNEFPDNFTSRQQMQKLVDACVNKLTDESKGPAFATVDMQVKFSTQFISRENIIFNHRKTVLNRTEPLIREIIDCGGDSVSDDETENLYRKLVIVITLLSGLGNPTNLPVQREAKAALHSVFPQTELNRFMALNREDKMKQIAELKQIVAGIRLFNKDCQKGGKGIDDVPSILQEAITVTRQNLEKADEEVEAVIARCVMYLNKMYREEPVDVENAGSLELVKFMLDLPDMLTVDDAHFLRDYIVLHKQQQIYIRKLLEEVKLCSEDIEQLNSRISDRLYQIHETVRYRTAIPTTQVYPQFMDLSISWSGLQDQMVVLSTINCLCMDFKEFAKFELLTEEKLEVLDGIDVPAPSMDSEDVKINPSKVKCEVVEYVETENFDIKKVQYNGCCAFRFVESNGVLFPSNLNLGLLYFEKKLFAFSNVKAAHTFGQNPDKYYRQGLSIVSKQPQLVVLFDMDDQMQNIKLLKTKPSGEISIKTDAEIQTELHPIESYIDPTYKWNTWDYKHEAIKMANISKQRTHSIQTDDSHFRESIGVQAAPPRTKQSQTKRDSYTNVPHPLNFIFGLRGRYDDKQSVIDLTRPVNN